MPSKCRLPLALAICVCVSFIHGQAESVNASTNNLAQSCHSAQASLHDCVAVADDAEVMRASFSMLQLQRNLATTAVPRSENLESVIGEVSREDTFGPRLLSSNSACASGLTAHLGTDVENSLAHPERTDIGIAPALNATLKVINVGQGTTATHEFFYAMARKGIPVIHWKSDYFVDNATRDIHMSLVHDWQRAGLHCMNEANKTDPLCLIAPQRHEWIVSQLRMLVSSGVVALADEPYTSYLPEIFALVPGVRVVQTLRNADSWAVKRILDHPNEAICKNTSVIHSYFNQAECTTGRTFFADSMEPMGNAGALPQKYAAHNAYVQQMVPPQNLWQVCAWDGEEGDFNIEIERIASRFAFASRFRLWKRSRTKPNGGPSMS